MICQSCNAEKSVKDFPVRNDRSGRLRPYCKQCANNISRARYQHHKNTKPFTHRCTRARIRAKSLKVPFDLTPEYLESIWTGICPVTKKQIYHNCDRSYEYAAELDRLVPEKGYVKGNVNWLSRRANRLKNSVSFEEIEQLAIWMKEVQDAGKFNR